MVPVYNQIKAEERELFRWPEQLYGM